MNPIDISSEKFREYVFTDGFVYRVNLPCNLYIKSKPEGDSHRVVDVSLVTHYIPAGWRAIRWEATPTVSF